MNLNVIEVNQNDFQKEVIQRSNQLPVIVDFWAPWCGPCRMIGPVLERLAGEYNGRFILAKVNADHNPQLSAQYDVRGIPAVKAFWNGRVVDEFVGAQPEPMIRQFIQRLMTEQQLPQQKTPQHTRQLSKDPAIRIQLAKQLLKEGKGCEAQTQLSSFPAGGEHTSALKLLPLAQYLCEANRGFPNTNTSELDTAYQQAAQFIERRDYGAALYNLLVILNHDSQYRSGQTPKIMLGLFELLGENNPLTQAYKQQYTHSLA